MTSVDAKCSPPLPTALNRNRGQTLNAGYVRVGDPFAGSVKDCLK